MNHYDTPAQSKKHAKEAIQQLLDKLERDIRSQLSSNRYDMAKLVNQQTKLKRELAELTKLRNVLAPKPKAETKK